MTELFDNARTLPKTATVASGVAVPVVLLWEIGVLLHPLAMLMTAAWLIVPTVAAIQLVKVARWIKCERQVVQLSVRHATADLHVGVGFLRNGSS